jgi:GT2 family glycosyltransferase/glycosyltransferase involved in cell wall biosynthesis
MNDVPGYVFDDKFYRSFYPDIANACNNSPEFDARAHFFEHGLIERRQSSLFFNPELVRMRLAKVSGREIPVPETVSAFLALPHEDRFVPNDWFNAHFFRTEYGHAFDNLEGMSDYAAFEFYLAEAGLNFLSPNGLFAEEAYRSRYPELDGAIDCGVYASGFHHYIVAGVHARLEWCSRIEGVVLGHGLSAGTRRDLLLSPEQIGAHAGPDVAPWFDEAFYLATNPDVHELRRYGRFKSGLEHFLAFGVKEGRVPHPALAGEAVAAGRAGTMAELVARAAQSGRRLPGALAMRDAALLRSYMTERGWVRDPAALLERLWSRIERPAVGGSFDAARYLAVNTDVRDAIGAGNQQGALAHWQSAGLAEQRIAPGTNVFADRIVTLADLVTSAPAGVNYFGPISLPSGMGVAARGYIAALRAAGVPVAAFDVSGCVRPGAVIDPVAPADLPYRYNIFHLNPDQILPLVARLGTGIFDRRLNVGLWVWELPSPRPEWRSVLSGFDLIVTPSLYNREAFAAFTTTKTFAVPHPIEPSALRPDPAAPAAAHPALTALERARKSGKRIVLFIMDASSYVARKGLDAYLELARTVERETPGAYVFCVKAHSRDRASGDVTAMLRSAPVTVIDELFDTTQLAALRRLADLYVSPHRSEGFGLNVFECLLAGTPVLVSRAGGVTDLLGEDYPLYIEGSLQAVGRDMGPYRAASVWFEPDPADMLDRFRRFFAEPKPVLKTLAALAKRIERAVAPEAVGRQFRDILALHGGFGLDLGELGRTLAAPHTQTLDIPGEAIAGPQARNLVSGLLAPVFSFVTPTWNTRPQWLRELYEDIKAQTVTSWEWCIHDDGSTDPETLAELDALKRRDARVVVRTGSANAGIATATNRAAELSSGQYLVLVDHDDRVAPRLLQAYLEVLSTARDSDILYCDEDKLLPDGSYGDHYFKPDWSPEHAMSVMYVLHCLCIRKDLFLKLRGYRRDYSGSQDHDFILRAAASGARIRHVDELLYHWRVVQGSAAGQADAKPYALDAGRRAVEDYARALGLDATVEPGLITGTYRVRPKIGEHRVAVNILTGAAYKVDPGKGRLIYAEALIRSLIRFRYPVDVEFRLITDMRAIPAISPLAKLDKRVKVVPFERTSPEFNFSEKVNFSVRSTDRDTIVLMNDDMEALDKDWLPALIELLELPGVGITGGRLLYEGDAVQHAGIALGVNGASVHLFGGAPADYIGYNGFTHVIRNYSAVTGALMAFRRDTFDRLGGLDERYPIDFNDTDFCLRAVESGLRVVYTPFSVMRHYESRSAVRWAADRLDTEAFSARWRAVLERDPYYNRHLARTGAFCEARGTGS